MQRNAPVAFTSRCARQSSSVVRASGRSDGQPRVVDENVDAADPLEEGLHRRLVRDVELVMAGRMDLIVGEPLGDRLADPLRTTRHDDHAAHAASAFRSSLPDGVFGRSSTNTTSRGYLCGESRARTKSCSACCSTGCLTTTYARGMVNPFRAAPTTAHSTTSGWPTRQCSISAGATQIPPTLIRSSTRPRYQKNPSSSRSNRSPVWTVSPSKVALRLLRRRPSTRARPCRR